MPRPLPRNQQLEWKKRIEAQQASGMSASRWCEKHHITTGSFYYWKERWFPKCQQSFQLDRSNFKELKDSQSPDILIEYHNFRIHLGRGCQLSTIKICLQALMEIEC